MQRPEHFTIEALRPDDVQRACFDKRRFYSKNAARDEAARAKNRQPELDMRPYRRMVCHQFHLTSAKKKRLPKIKAELRRRA